MGIRVIYRLLGKEILLELELFLSAEILLELELAWDWTPTTSQSQGDTLYSTVQLADWSNRQELRLARITERRTGRSQARDWSFMWRLDLKPKSTWLFWIKNGPLSSFSGRPGSISGSKLFLGMWLVVYVETWSPTKIYLGVLNKKWPTVKSFGRPGSYSRSGHF